MGRFVFKLPDVGEGTAEAELVGWHVKVGDVVAEDQIVADVMTDKATVEITAPVSGKVIAVHGEPGQMIPVRGPLVEFEVEGAGNADSSPFPLEGKGRDGVSPPSVLEKRKRRRRLQAPPSRSLPPPPFHPTPPPSRGRASGSANYVFKLPDVGEGTAEAELVGWHVKVGDAVAEDQVIADVMTDKATGLELTSPVSGTVVALHGEAGQQVAVGGPWSASRSRAPETSRRPRPRRPLRPGRRKPLPLRSPRPRPLRLPTASAKPVAEAFTTRAAEGTSAGLAGRAQPRPRPGRRAAVRARLRPGRPHRARRPGRLCRLGRPRIVHGRIIWRFDLRQGRRDDRGPHHRPAPQDRREDGRERASHPHITYVEEIDVTALEELRAHLNAQAKAGGKAELNVLPFIARAIVVALRDQPQINATYDDEAGVLTPARRRASGHRGPDAERPDGAGGPPRRGARSLRHGGRDRPGLGRGQGRHGQAR